jgi:hypothetical protein
MRLFLALLLFDIVFRSLSVLWPWKSWSKQLAMQRLPVRLATRAELDRERARAQPGAPDPFFEDAFESLDSIWEFFKPWPGPKTRRKIHNWRDGGKFALFWLGSRFEFLENVVGINEEWPMFSPSCTGEKYIGRARLHYADGTTAIHRQLGDPADKTRFAHWNEEKRLDHELKICKGRDEDDCWGYCNWLGHRYARNENGSPLKRIVLFTVRYESLPPGEDAYTWWKAQSGPPRDQHLPPFYEYDVATRHGKSISRK